MGRGQGREHRGSELIIEVYNDLDEEGSSFIEASMFHLLEFAVAAPSVVNRAAAGADPRLPVQWLLLWELQC